MIVLTVMSIFFVGLDARTLLAQDELFDVTAAQRAHGSVSELPFEHIDMSSGSVVLTFTDLVLPGNAATISSGNGPTAADSTILQVPARDSAAGPLAWLAR